MSKPLDRTLNRMIISSAHTHPSFVKVRLCIILHLCQLSRQTSYVLSARGERRRGKCAARINIHFRKYQPTMHIRPSKLLPHIAETFSKSDPTPLGSTPRHPSNLSSSRTGQIAWPVHLPVPAMRFVRRNGLIYSKGRRLALGHDSVLS
jgi:hypothetical protein